MKPNIVRLESVDSTNNHLATIAATAPHGTIVTTHAQTAGRGQRGNSWESTPGLNVTLSALFRPENFPANRQFVISEIVALATMLTVNNFLPDQSTKAAVKWPNDIYVGDRKIAGILIENSLAGNNISYSIAGIGLNVNQPEFLSDAPNPVSLRQIRGEETSLSAVESELISNLYSMFNDFSTENRQTALHSFYLRNLWRREGEHRFFDNLRGEEITASIVDVAPTGHLTLQLSDGSRRSYAFKEVAFIL